MARVEVLRSNTSRVPELPGAIRSDVQPMTQPGQYKRTWEPAGEYGPWVTVRLSWNAGDRCWEFDATGDQMSRQMLEWAADWMQYATMVLLVTGQQVGE